MYRFGLGAVGAALILLELSWAHGAPRPSPSPSPSAGAPLVGPVEVTPDPPITAQLTEAPPHPKETPISGLRWEGEGEFEVKWMSDQPGHLRGEVILRGIYPRHHWELLCSSEATEPLKRKEDGRFSLPISLLQPVQRYRFSAVGPKGLVEITDVIVKVREWAALHAIEKEARSPSPPKLNFFSLGLNTSWIQYSDPWASNYSEIALTVKGAYTRVLSRALDIGASFYFTALPLTRSLPYDARFLGVNGRLAWSLPWPRAPWTLAIAGGYYYTTMFVTDNAFGFSNLHGPQLFPTLKRKFGGSKMLAFYFKYSPVSSGGIALMDLSSREIAAGGSFAFPLGRKLSLAVTADFSWLNVVIEEAAVASSTVSLGGSLGF